MKKSKKINNKALMAAIAITVGSSIQANAADNLFGLKNLNSNTDLLLTEGNCGEGACGKSEESKAGGCSNSYVENGKLKEGYKFDGKELTGPDGKKIDICSKTLEALKNLSSPKAEGEKVDNVIEPAAAAGPDGVAEKKGAENTEEGKCGRGTEE